MNFIYKVGLVFVALIFLGCKEAAKEQAVDGRPPNILFILVDDLGKEWVGCYGAEDIVTPNIDQLAESGMRFNNVYSMPQCTPSRVTLLTGQYPFRHGWVNHWDVPRWGGGAHFDETQNPSLVQEMRRAGYKTCIAGKWQIDDFRVEPDALIKAGFDEFCMWTGYEAGVEASAERYWDPYIFTKEGSKTYAGAFGPDIFRDFIVRFLKENKEEPMFVYYPMVLTHTPFVSTPDEAADDNMGKHKAMVRYTDKIVGELVEALKQNDLFENTMVVFTTDNGTTSAITGTYKGRPIKGGKARTVEAGICEPFIVSWPGTIEPRQTSEALIDFTDLLPTFIDIAGGGSPDQWTANHAGQPIDGKSFKDVLLGTTDSAREWILGMGGGNKARLTEKGVENQYNFRDRVLRNKRYKLYIDSNSVPEKFFDLKEDPFEEHNIIDSLNTEERLAHFERLKKVLESFPKKDSDPKYRPNPDQEWDVEVTAKSGQWKI
ncbi:sulfatase-like hydrolase/transferase [Pseudozobellia thermophila]|uniref:Arylsulfatase A n=1 Tax=Pseudozobellia thermophila TaxID=192903 RepID=A0A1M6NXB5_9FLAO|nr:sulfatase-like hydrolase/transferase [Pseudozobellia thermophila]SHK00278.1 Arylsulfatase A [Pseudozobellia thermophila]